jgi:hypothetical protein
VTEAEWLECADPKPIMEFLQTKLSARKARLLAVNCCRGCLEAAMTDLLRAALDAGEIYADDPGALDLAVNAERAASQASFGAYTRAQQSAWSDTWREWAFAAATGAVSSAAIPKSGWLETRWLSATSGSAIRAAGCAARAAARTDENANDEAILAERTAEADARACHCALARCVAGATLFRRVEVAPQWLTDTVLLLARQMYDSRDFGAMPILADALQDAGCDNEAILSHCRGEGPHVRGCWVVDLVLGKV